MRVKVLARSAGLAACLAVAGMAGFAGAQTTPHGGAVPPRFEDIVKRMSPEGQAIMAEAVSRSTREQRKLDALKATREQILQLLAAPQLDSEALARAFERERILSQKVQANRQASLLQAATQLSAEDRKLFAEGLRSTRLHIPGEPARQIVRKAEQTRQGNCAADKPAR